MKTTTVILTGLITCTTVLHAQSVSSISQDRTSQLAAAGTFSYQEIIWTNSVIFPSLGRQNHEGGISIMSVPDRAAESDLSETNIDYQVLVLPRGEKAPKEDTGGAAATETKSPSINGFAVDDFFYWHYGMPRKTQASQKETTGKKKPDQHLYIEPLSAPHGTAPDHSILREYMLAESRPKSAWYEWLNPRAFIPKWTEFWMTESDATPVVLVRVGF